MHTSKHCSIRTFWLGYCDWFRTRAQMSHKEVWEETRRENKGLGRKLFLFPLVVFAALAWLALSARTLVQHSVSAGVSTKGVALVSQWGTFITMGAVVGYIAVTKSLKVARFCAEMCARGQALEAALAKA